MPFPPAPVLGQLHEHNGNLYQYILDANRWHEISKTMNNPETMIEWLRDGKTHMEYGTSDWCAERMAEVADHMERNLTKPMECVEITLSVATIIDRLRKVQQNLTDENRHNEAFILESAIQALMQKR